MTENKDILPSYQLHEHLSRDINEVVADLKLAAKSNPTYSSRKTSCNSTSSFSSSPDATSQRPSSGIDLSTAIQDNQPNYQDITVNRYHAENNYRDSLLAHFYDLRYKMQDAIDIFISIEDVGELNTNVFKTADKVHGFFRIYNKSIHKVDLGVLLVTLEANFWWKVRRDNRTKLITKSFMTMVDIEASKLESPNFLKPGDYKQYPFSFIIPELDTEDKALPPSFGCLHYLRTFSSEMSDTMNFEKEPEDYFRTSDQFSICYSVNVRSLVLNPKGDNLEIRKHTRHIINFNPTTLSAPVMNDLEYRLTPNQELQILMKCYEQRLRFYHFDCPSPSSSAPSSPPSSCSSSAAAYLYDPSVHFDNAVSTLNVRKSISYYNMKEKTIKRSIQLQHYNPNEVPDEELRNKLRPNAYDNPGIRLFQLDKKRKGGGYDLGPSFPFEYRLLSNHHPVLTAKRSFTISINTELRLKKVELYSLNVFSTVKLPFELSPSWFINAPDQSLYSQVIKPKVDNLLSEFEKLQETATATSPQSEFPLKDLTSLSFISSQAVKTSKTLKLRQAKMYHCDNVYDVSLDGLKKSLSGLVRPFSTDYSELFYFIRFSFKLPRGMSYKQEEYAYFDVPVELVF